MLSKYDEIRARRARGEQGFSLIELLVVVVIMGILIAIAVPVYLNYQKGAKNKSVEADVRNAIPAVEQCISDNGGALTGISNVTAGTKGAAITITKCGTGPDQKANVSPGNTLTLTISGSSYTLVGTGETGHTATYTSADGKTVTAS